MMTDKPLLAWTFDDDGDVYLIKITTWQWATKFISILIQNQPKRHKYKMESIDNIHD
jgi:hypothetical protein